MAKCICMLVSALILAGGILGGAYILQVPPQQATKTNSLKGDTPPVVPGPDEKNRMRTEADLLATEIRQSEHEVAIWNKKLDEISARVYYQRTPGGPGGACDHFTFPDPYGSSEAFVKACARDKATATEELRRVSFELDRMRVRHAALEKQIDGK